MVWVWAQSVVIEAVVNRETVMTAASNNAPVNAPAPAPVQTAIAITQAPSEVVVNREIAIAGTADFTQVLQILVTLAGKNYGWFTNCDGDIFAGASDWCK